MTEICLRRHRDGGSTYRQQHTLVLHDRPAAAEEADDEDDRAGRYAERCDAEEVEARAERRIGTFVDVQPDADTQRGASEKLKDTRQEDGKHSQPASLYPD